MGRRPVYVIPAQSGAFAAHQHRLPYHNSWDGVSRLDGQNGRGRIQTVVTAPNHAMERTVTRRTFTFRVARTLSLRLARALAGRRSSYSR